MSKPLNENIRALRIETETGDLVPLLDHAGSEFAAPHRLTERTRPRARASARPMHSKSSCDNCAARTSD